MPMNTDQDMLRLCLEAFEAIPKGDDSRKLLKKIGIVAGPYAGYRSHVLALEMVERLRVHLNIKPA